MGGVRDSNGGENNQNTLYTCMKLSKNNVIENVVYLASAGRMKWEVRVGRDIQQSIIAGHDHVGI